MKTDTKAKQGRRSLGSRLKTYLLTGILVTGPAFITCYTTFGLVNIADRWVKSFLPESLYPEMRIFGIPGMGLLMLLGVLVLVGFVTASWIGRIFFKIADKAFANTPILSSLYSTLKQLFHTFFGENITSFRQVVYVEYPREGCWSIGFVTGSAPSDAESLDRDMMYVFIPTTPNPTNGWLALIPASKIRKSEMTVEQGLKAVVSMGITSSGESEADFPAP